MSSIFHENESARFKLRINSGSTNGDHNEKEFDLETKVQALSESSLNAFVLLSLFKTSFANGVWTLSDGGTSYYLNSKYLNASCLHNQEF